MRPFNGNDDFGERFDFFKWSAPFYETPEEVVECILNSGMVGKRLKGVFAIGVHEHSEISWLIGKQLKAAGIECRDVMTYRHLDKVLVPWQVRFCEPTQLVFEDDSTLEILPTKNGGARIGCNTVPPGHADGLNRSDFDTNVFFAETLGKEFMGFSFTLHESREIDKYSLCRENPRRQKSSEYCFQFKFEGFLKLELVQTWESWYWIKLQDTVPYARLKAAKKQCCQIPIVNGRDGGGVFWICPIHLDPRAERGWFVDNYGMAIDEMDVDDYLWLFLLKYFDQRIQDRERYERIVFDGNDKNYYTFDSMKMMLRDIREACRIMREDFSDPRVSDITKEFAWYRYTDKNVRQITEEEKQELCRMDMDRAIDFYERFCQRIEHMMALPGYNAVSFAGP